MDWIQKSKELETERRQLPFDKQGSCWNCEIKFEEVNIQVYKNKIGIKLYCEDCFLGSPQVNMTLNFELKIIFI